MSNCIRSILHHCSLNVDILPFFRKFADLVFSTNNPLLFYVFPSLEMQTTFDGAKSRQVVKWWRKTEISTFLSLRMCVCSPIKLCGRRGYKKKPDDVQKSDLFVRNVNMRNCAKKKTRRRKKLSNRWMNGYSSIHDGSTIDGHNLSKCLRFIFHWNSLLKQRICSKNRIEKTKQFLSAAKLSDGVDKWTGRMNHIKLWVVVALEFVASSRRCIRTNTNFTFLLNWWNLNFIICLLLSTG